MGMFGIDTDRSDTSRIPSMGVLSQTVAYTR